MRSIRLYDSESCGADNPFFVSRVIVSNRLSYQFLERLDLVELFPPVMGTKQYTVANLDPLLLQDVFNIVGVTSNINLIFTDTVTVFELFSTDRTQGTTAGYVDGVVISETFSVSDRRLIPLKDFVENILLLEDFLYRTNKGQSTVLSDLVAIFEEFNTIKTRTLQQLVADGVNVNEIFETIATGATNGFYADSISVMDVLTYAKTSGNKEVLHDFLSVVDEFILSASGRFMLSLVDTVGISETFSAVGVSMVKLFFAEELFVSDLLNYSKGGATTQGYTESISLGEQWNLFLFGPSALCLSYKQTLEDIGGEVHNFSALCKNLNAFNTNVRPPQATFNSYSEFVSLFDFVDIDRNRQYTQNHDDALTVSDILTVNKTIQSVVNNLIDGVMLGEDFDIRGTVDKLTLLTDLVLTSDTFAYFRSQAVATLLNDFVTVSEIFETRSIGAVTNFYTDNVSINDTFNQQTSKGYSWVLSDNVNIAELFNIQETRASVFGFIDTLSAVDQFEYQRSSNVANGFTESIGVSDVFQVATSSDVVQYYTDTLSVADVMEYNRTLATGNSFDDGVSVSESILVASSKGYMYSFADNISITDTNNVDKSGSVILFSEDQITVSDVLTFRDTSTSTQGYTDSVSLGEQWGIFKFGQSALCFSYKQTLDDIGGEVHNFSALCQNLNAFNENVRPPQVAFQSYADSLTLGDDFFLDKDRAYGVVIEQGVNVDEVFNFDKTVSLTNNLHDSLLLSEIFSIFGITDKNFVLTFEEGVSLFEDRDFRNRSFQFTDSFDSSLTLGEDFVYTTSKNIVFGFIDGVTIDAGLVANGNFDRFLYFEERLDLVGLQDFAEINKQSNRLLTFVEGVNLIEGQN